MSEFVMPSLGADMEAGTLVEWLVKPGSVVHRGDIVAVVETEKGAIEVEIFEEGVIEELLVPVGKLVPVGTPLARIAGTGGGAGPPAPPPAGVAEPRPVPAPLRASPAAVAAPRRAGLRASPAARRRAQELGVALDGLVGSGPDGAITFADVEAAARGAAAEATGPPPRAAPSAPAARGFEPAAMRRAIAAAMSRAKREIPHYYLTTTIELARATAFLEARNRGSPPAERLLPAVLLLKATALALREVPELNGFWLDDGFRPGPGIHVGWAVALRGGGLVAPAIKQADTLALPELMAALRDLVGRARSGGLRSSELAGPTITITSLGERGAEAVLPVIYPPQVAIVGFGRIVTAARVGGRGGVVARPVIQASLAGDHRASDGHLGGRLLAAIDRLLNAPEQL